MGYGVTNHEWGNILQTFTGLDRNLVMSGQKLGHPFKSTCKHTCSFDMYEAWSEPVVSLACLFINCVVVLYFKKDIHPCL